MPEIKLLKGDCLELMNEIPDKSIDLILCDLPYGFTNCQWDSVIDLNSLWQQYKRILNFNGTVVLFGNQPFTTTLINSNLRDFSHIWYWKKNNVTNGLQARRMPMRCIEDICVFRCSKSFFTYNPQGVYEMKTPKNKIEKENRRYQVYDSPKPKIYKQAMTGYPKNLLEINQDKDVLTNKKRLHPTQKPVALLEYLIKTYTKEGETVLDNCMGSGSTGIACLNTDRNFIGIELDENYFNIAENRINQAKTRNY